MEQRVEFFQSSTVFCPLHCLLMASFTCFCITETYPKLLQISKKEINVDKKLLTIVAKRSVFCLRGPWMLLCVVVIIDVELDFKRCEYLT